MEKQERIERAIVDTLRDEIRTGLDSGAGKRAEDVFARLEEKYSAGVRALRLRPFCLTTEPQCDHEDVVDQIAAEYPLRLHRGLATTSAGGTQRSA